MALDPSSNGTSGTPRAEPSGSTAGASSACSAPSRQWKDTGGSILEGTAGARPLVADPLSVVLTMRDAEVQAYVAVVRNVLASKQVGRPSRDKAGILDLVSWAASVLRVIGRACR